MHQVKKLWILWYFGATNSAAMTLSFLQDEYMMILKKFAHEISKSEISFFLKIQKNVIFKWDFLENHEKSSMKHVRYRSNSLYGASHGFHIHLDRKPGAYTNSECQFFEPDFVLSYLVCAIFIRYVYFRQPRHNNSIIMLICRSLFVLWVIRQLMKKELA